MPLSSAVRQRCRELLPPGTEVHYLFPASSSDLPPATRSGWLASLLPSGMTPVLVAVTDHHVVLLECSWLSHNRPKSVHMRFPRRIQLGPVDTSTDGPVFRVGNFNFETDDEYVSVIMAADAEISGEGYLPPDPLPDL